ncbi:effector-associated constant component EACC1 [Uniformispora flossi]|uniref:effector-associated constant component EACC1 n=1 Tax=Uniformispora flossi TaxID=3390723 RepID=UPI003C2AC96B
MGAYEIVDVALTHGAALGSLLVSFLTWRGTRSTQPPITISVDARPVTLPDGTPSEVQALLAALAPPPAQPDGTGTGTGTGTDTDTDTAAASDEDTGAPA